MRDQVHAPPLPALQGEAVEGQKEEDLIGILSGQACHSFLRENPILSLSYIFQNLSREHQ